MRVPGVKIWRAFEELDHLTDSECQSLIVRVYLQVSPLRMRVFAAISVLIGIAAAVGALYAMYRLGLTKGDQYVILVGVLTLIVGVGALSLAFLLLRDLHVYLLIRSDLERSNCRACGQSLIGVPVLRTALHPGTPGDGRVRCPECGREWILLEVGLTDRDLIPFEQRIPSSEIGKLRRR